MFRLQPAPDAETITLTIDGGDGKTTGRIVCQAPLPAHMAIARERAIAAMTALIRDGRIDGEEKDLKKPTSDVNIAFEAAMATELLKLTITSWDFAPLTGDELAPVSRRNIEQAMADARVYQAVVNQLLYPTQVLAVEKNGFAPSPNSTSEGAPDSTATTAAADTKPAANGGSKTTSVKNASTA